jgi:hypothetical protein
MSHISPASDQSRAAVLADPLFNGIAYLLVAVGEFSIMRFTESLPTWFAVISLILCGIGSWIIFSRKELGQFKHGLPTLTLVLIAAIYAATYVYAVWFVPPQTVKDGTIFSKFADPYTPRIVSGKTFENEKVLLDGIEYDYCIFTNVTFVYNGTTSIRFTHNTVSGFVRIASDNPAVTGAFLFLYGFGATENVKLESLDTSSHIELPIINGHPQNH